MNCSDKNYKNYSINLSKSDYEALEECCEILGVTKAELIRISIKVVHDKIVNKRCNK